MRAGILGALVAVILSIFAFTVVTNAQTFRSGAEANVAQQEKIDGTAWLSGTNVNVAGTVDGDLFCAGQNVTISGEVDGDVLCAGQTVTISGVVRGNVRTIGQTVDVSGSIDGSMTAGGQTVLLGRDSNVGRDASLAGQNVHVDGEIGRDLALGAGSVTVSSDIGRNLGANVSNLTLVNSATVGGNLAYTSPQKMTIGSGASIKGNVSYTKTKGSYKPSTGISNKLGFGLAILWSLMLIVSALLLVLLFPREFHSTTNESAHSFGKALFTVLTGFVASIVVPVLIVLVMFTVLGIPFAIIMLAIWLLILLISGAVGAYYLGRFVWPRQNNAVLIMLVGSILAGILLIIPIVNIFVWIFGVWYGSGALLLQLKNQMAAPSYNMKNLKADRKSK